MRVGLAAHRLSRLNGGVAESVRLASNALDAAGVDCALFALDDRHLSEDRAGFRVREVHAARSAPVPRYGWAPTLSRAMQGAGVELMHVHGLWATHADAAWRWHKRTGRRFVISPHGMLEPWILARSPRLKRLILALYQQRMLEAASAFHVLTDEEARDVRALVPDARCEVVPNFVEMADPVIEPPAWWRREDAGKTVFLFFGRIHAKKGIAELLDAWGAFCEHERGADCLLVIAGWVDGVDDLDERVAGAGRRLSNVRFVGPQHGEEKARTLAAASFLILPSKSEGLPMVVLEAWAAGVPVLMTEACNLAEGFAGEAAIRIGEDVPGIVGGLVAASAMDDAGRAMGERGRALVAERFSEAAFTRRMIGLYESVLHG